MAASLLGAYGCGQSGESNLSGVVTYNGEPVAKGFITFTPTASGTSVGAEVVDGKYTTEKARPGQFKVVVQGDRDAGAPMTREQAERQAKAAQRQPQSPSYIPENAEGNGQTVEITGGGQTLDFALIGPPRQ